MRRRAGVGSAGGGAWDGEEESVFALGGDQRGFGARRGGNAGSASTSTSAAAAAAAWGPRIAAHAAPAARPKLKMHADSSQVRFGSGVGAWARRGGRSDEIDRSCLAQTTTTFLCLPPPTTQIGPGLPEPSARRPRRPAPRRHPPDRPRAPQRARGEGAQPPQRAAAPV